MIKDHIVWLGLISEGLRHVLLTQWVLQTIWSWKSPGNTVLCACPPILHFFKYLLSATVRKWSLNWMGHCAFLIESLLYLLLTKRQWDVSWTEDLETNNGHKILNMLPAQCVWKAQAKFREAGDFTDHPHSCSLQERLMLPQLSCSTALWRQVSKNRGQHIALSGQLSVTVWFCSQRPFWARQSGISRLTTRSSEQSTVSNVSTRTGA